MDHSRQLALDHCIGFTRLALRERFTRARAEGDLPAASDPAALARYLTTVSNGLAVQAAAGDSGAQLHAVADIALASFPGAPAKTPQPA